MSRPYYFDQLFEKLPNGSYRERPKPVAPLDIYHRHDFVRSERTGRICVVYPAKTWGDMVRLGMAKIGSSCHEPDKPLLGGNWFHGSRIDDLRRSAHCGLDSAKIDPLYAPRWNAQPASSDGTNDGSS